MLADFEWAWFNVATRCLAHYHLPNDIAMCPLVDLLNHQAYQQKAQFFIEPKHIDEKLTLL